MTKRTKILLTLYGVLALITLGFLYWSPLSGKLKALADVFSPITQQGTTYYVATDGDDSNPGTFEQPLSFTNKLDDILSPGDIVYFREGTYDIPLEDPGDTAHGFAIRSYGTEELPITFRNYPGEHVVWDNKERAADAIEIKAEYVVLDGIELINGRGYTINVYEKYFTIRNSVLHDDDTDDQTDDLIKVLDGSGYVLIENNEFYGKSSNFLDIFGDYTEIKNNYFHDYIQGGQEQAVQIKGGNIGTKVHHNLFLRCSPPDQGGVDWTSSVLQIGGGTMPQYLSPCDIGKRGPDDPGYEGCGLEAYNNLIVGGKHPGIVFVRCSNCSAYNNTIIIEKEPGSNEPRRAIGIRDSSIDITIKNNIVVSDNEYLLLVMNDGSAEGLVSDNNIWYSTSGNTKMSWLTDDFRYPWDAGYTFEEYQSLTGQDQNSLNVNPIPDFVDPANNDFHLQSTSPAIDAGTSQITDTIPAPSTDYDGVARPQGGAPDIGAYEHQTDAPTISNISTSDITTNSAKITWDTDKDSDSTVEYGTSQAYGQSKPDSDMTQSHSINLDNLLENTEYHFRVKSKDAEDNQAVSSDQTFTTQKEEEPPPEKLSDGTLIKTAKRPEVYVIFSGRKKHIVNPNTLINCGFSWSKIKIVSDSELNQYPTGRKLYKLWKSPSDPKVYLMSKGKRYWITSPRVFSRFGFNWSHLTVIPQDYLDQREEEMNLYTLQRAHNQSEVYLIFKNYKRHIRNPISLINLGFDWGLLRNVSPDQLNQKPTKSPSMRNVIKGPSDPIYFLINGVKRWIPSPTRFYELGLHPNDIISVPQGLVDMYPRGSNM